MAKSRIPRILGLATAPNEISQTPPGSLVQADNVVIRDRGLVEPRRGFRRYIGLADRPDNFEAWTPNSLSEDAVYSHASFEFDAPYILSFFNKDNPSTSLSQPGVFLSYIVGSMSGGTEADVSNVTSWRIESPDNSLSRARFAKYGGVQYLLSSLGLREPRMSSYNWYRTSGNTEFATTHYRWCGLQKPVDPAFVYTLGPQGITAAPGATGNWLSANSSVSYRVTFGIYEKSEDIASRFKESAPSGRFIVRCPANQSVTISRAGSSEVTVTSPAAHNLLTGDIVSILPSVTTAFASGSFTITSTPSATTFTYNDATSTGTTTLAAQTLTVGPKQVAFRLFCDDLRLGTVDGSVIEQSEQSASPVFRIYRTKVTTGHSNDPGDEHFLIAESVFTNTQLQNGYLDITDTTPEAGLGPPLYTNPATGEGILQANDAPPFAKDVASWGERLWFANTQDHQVLNIKLLGVGSPNGLQANDELWFAETRFDVVSNITNIGSSNPRVFSEFSSVSRNIEFTARNLVAAINNYRAFNNSGASGTGIPSPRVKTTTFSQAPNTVFELLDTFPYAYYNDDPSRIGEITLVVPNPIAPEFTWYSSRSTAWAKPPTTASTTLVVSAGDITVLANSITALMQVSVTNSLQAGDFVVLKDDVSLTSGTLYGGVYEITPFGPGGFRYTQRLRVGSPAPSGTSSGTATFYALPQSAQTFWSSQNTVGKNRLYYSKVNQPEAVPLLNYIDVGAKDAQILRIHPLNDVLFVFKEDGLFTVSGQEPFSVDLFDPTVILASPDSVAALNNLLFALTTKGVVKISTAGAQIISEPIDDLIKNRANTYIRRYPFGVGAEDDDLYYLWLPNTDQICREAFVYNTEYDGWTRIEKSAGCGTYTPFDGSEWGRNLFIGALQTPYIQFILRERKTVDNATYGFPFNQDYADEITSFSISTVVNATTLIIPGGVGITAGMFLAQGTSAAGLVTAVTGNTVTIVPDASLSAFTTASTALAYEPISVAVRFTPDFAGNPDEDKHYRDLQLLFQRHNFYNPEATFSTEYYTTTLAEPVTRTPDTNNVKLNQDIASIVSVDNERVGIPRNVSRCVYLTVGFSMQEAFSFFRLAGYSLVGETMSERIKK